ncbi:hypothetical protein acsn021_43600 [Anaerocolumna cellulosilytica]|uniref:Uncharacterized protein n=1 Tax=Anaerocolumna cellulosilytica TaxID=433286 RepID=A0A6S6RDJ2_9FIRM|nr:hypothetical protein acsn021_43600 [Anaerocolumna cellulosilytica]
MTIGNPANRNPKPVINATDTAVYGDINIAIKIGTWLANVKDAGSRIILIGENIGIDIPIAHNNAEIVIN